MHEITSTIYLSEISLLLIAMNTRQTVLVSIAIFLVCGLAVWWYFGFSLDFMNFFAAEPANNTLVTQSPSSTVSPVVSCAPETRSVLVGAPATLTGSGGNSVYQWFAPTGTPSTGTGASFSVVYNTPGTKKVTIQSQRGNGSPQVDSIECTVVVTP